MCVSVRAPARASEWGGACGGLLGRVEWCMCALGVEQEWVWSGVLSGMWGAVGGSGGAVCLFTGDGLGHVGGICGCGLLRGVPQYPKMKPGTRFPLKRDQEVRFDSVLQFSGLRITAQCWPERRMTRPCGKAIWQHSPYDLAILLTGVDPASTRTHVHRVVCQTGNGGA